MMGSGDVSPYVRADRELASEARDYRLKQANILIGQELKRSEQLNLVTQDIAHTKEVELYHQMHLKIKSLLPTQWKNASWDVTKTIIESATEHQFDPIFLMAVIMNESGFRPLARGTSGEIGLMQILPKTAKWISAKTNIKWEGHKTLKNYKTNIKLGTFYLSMLRDKMGTKRHLYLAAYNMGARNVKRLLKRKTIPTIYSSKVLQHYMSFYFELGNKVKPSVFAQN